MKMFTKVGQTVRVLPFSLLAHLPQRRLSVPPQASGEQPRCLLFHTDRYPVQPGGLQAGVHRGPEPAADLPVSPQEEHGATGAARAAQGEEEPADRSIRPAQRLPAADGGGLGLPGSARGRRGRGGRAGGCGRRSKRVPGDAAGSVSPRPLERALQPGRSAQRRHRGLIFASPRLTLYFKPKTSHLCSLEHLYTECSERELAPPLNYVSCLELPPCRFNG